MRGNTQLFETREIDKINMANLEIDKINMANLKHY